MDHYFRNLLETFNLKRMKRILLLVALSSVFYTYSQEEVKKEEEKFKVIADVYFAFGLQFHDDFNLNQKLVASNVVPLNTTRPEFQVGMNIFGKKYSGDMEFAFSQNDEENETTKNKDMGFTGRFRFHYNLINKEKIAFTTGLSLAGTSTEVDLYSRNNTIDLNDLNPNNTVGLISIRNQQFYVGPSASLYLFRNKSYKLRLNVGYEFSFTNGKWKSDYASINNTVKESGNNRWLVGLVLF